MRFTVVGAGYVGLVAGTCFAEIGHTVTCVDLDRAKIDGLRQGRPPIYEHGLAEMIAENAHAGRLSFTTDVSASVADSDVIFIAVGTPPLAGSGSADLKYVFAAVRDVARAAQGDTTIVVKSTVPVGTCDQLERVARETNPEATIRVVSNPEFLREGVAIGDFLRPDRVVIGVEDARGEAVMRDVYRPLAEATQLLFVSRRTSEIIKYASNSFLAMKISFINEMADLCEAAGADVRDVARGIGLDHRIGGKFLNAGPGYGGSCFPKDTEAMLRTAEELDVRLRLVEATVDINAQRKRAMAARVAAACGGDVAGRRIAILGLTFKPDTDDMRDAPSIDIIAGLQEMGATVAAYDPVGEGHAAAVMSGVTFCSDPYEAAEGASAIVLVTEWNEFRAIDFARLASLVEGRAVVDLRNLWQPAEVEAHGFSYTGIGQGSRKMAGGPEVMPGAARHALETTGP